MKISEIITDKYKLRIPPTVYYDLLADVREVEEDQEPQTFKWCTGCREYDQEKHCCHRWSKVIRDTVEEMKQEQEPKPMVEIDLYSVIKQKYIEREVLDEMRVEVEMEKLEDSPNFCVKANNNAIDRVLGIIDKYKAETEAEDGNDH